MDDSPPAAAQPHRIGYREGFSDGYAESGRQHDDADASQKGGDRNGPGDDKKEGKPADDAKPDGEKDAGKNGDKKAGDEGEKKTGDGKPPLYKRPLVVGAALLVLLILILVAIVFWRHSKHHESTDDAFIDGQVSQVAAQTAGRVLKLYVSDNQLVEVGDPLVDIDSRDNDAQIVQSRSQVATAQGQLDQAEAQVGVRRANAAEADATVGQSEAEYKKAAQDLARYRRVDPDAVPRQEVDAAVAAERSAAAQLAAARMGARAAHAQIGAAQAQVRAGKAQVDAAQASLSTSQLQGTYTHVTAPVRGRVSKRTVEPGNVISNGQALMAIVGQALWVTANFKETQLRYMTPGLGVDIVVDAFPDLVFHGHVDSIQRGTGSYFSMLPAENATGNYIKVVQRVPVKILFDDNAVSRYAIGPGMSVTPNVRLP